MTKLQWFWHVIRSDRPSLQFLLEALNSARFPSVLDIINLATSKGPTAVVLAT